MDTVTQSAIFPVRHLRVFEKKQWVCFLDKALLPGGPKSRAKQSQPTPHSCKKIDGQQHQTRRYRLDYNNCQVLKTKAKRRDHQN